MHETDAHESRGSQSSALLRTAVFLLGGLAMLAVGIRMRNAMVCLRRV